MILRTSLSPEETKKGKKNLNIKKHSATNECIKEVEYTKVIKFTPNYLVESPDQFKNLETVWRMRAKELIYIILNIEN